MNKFIHCLLLKHSERGLFWISVFPLIIPILKILAHSSSAILI